MRWDIIYPPNFISQMSPMHPDFGTNISLFNVGEKMRLEKNISERRKTI